MPSLSYLEWTSSRAAQLDELEAAHAAVGGTQRGRRYATQQVNHAYAVLLSSQFQGFCRDLHSECVDNLLLAVRPAAIRTVLNAEFLWARQLDRGNATPGSIGADFGRLGVEIWGEIRRLDGRNADRQVVLEGLNNWRNAIAHQDFDPATLGGQTTLRLKAVRSFRSACNGLAKALDLVMFSYIGGVTKTSPW